MIVKLVPVLWGWYDLQVRMSVGLWNAIMSYGWDKGQVILTIPGETPPFYRGGSSGQE